MLSNQEIIKKRKFLDGKDVEIAKIFKTLSDPNRCKIFSILSTEPQLSVSTTADVLNISLPLASQHLKILLESGLLDKEKFGQQVFYKLKLDTPIVRSTLETIKKYVKHLKIARAQR
jgi:DNA-binding transcriptional ArsR family regulator